MRERLGIKAKRLALAVDTRKCINCKACVVACKAENDVPLGRFRNRINEDSGGVYPHLRASFEPEQCHHCESPSCVRVCPTGASYRRSDGLVLVDADDCIGCGYCIIACPYDARFFNDQTRVVEKCTMCAHRLDAGGVPACVETCPTKVRVLGDLEDPDSPLSLLLATRRNQVKKLQTGNDPQLHYLL
ncbi:MAG: 4Fe-4S dicluster domain-containing protein [Acidobacteriota bacterium]